MSPVPLEPPLAELRFSFARSGGPGGQNVNKVESKAVLRWDVARSPALPDAVRERFLARFRRRITSDGELVLASQRSRDRERNVADCVEKLRAMLAEVATPPKPRRATRPSRGARERRLAAKKAHARKKAERRPPSADR
ncbi:MAG TPA: alternative ribosome rescue aminoacyl-tRNA hydrolase ArfB [Myxococcota bacterium]|nr:alternative ribosome rescue aminoacyl-tRNA hydrolase ArfB [Myxococcota bacterium]